MHCSCVLYRNEYIIRCMIHDRPELARSLARKTGTQNASMMSRGRSNKLIFDRLSFSPGKTVSSLRAAHFSVALPSTSCSVPSALPLFHFCVLNYTFSTMAEPDDDLVDYDEEEVRKKSVLFFIGAVMSRVIFWFSTTVAVEIVPFRNC